MSAPAGWADSTPRRPPPRPTSNWWPSSIPCPTPATAWPPSAAPGRWPTTASCSGEIDAAVDRRPDAAAPSRSRWTCSARASTCWSRSRSAATLAEADELVEAARHQRRRAPGGPRRAIQPGVGRRRCRTSADPKYIEAVRASGFTFRSTDVGVVLDLMIHDIDLVLSLVDSPVRRVEALGLSVLGGHEDVANARIEFESGCVATLSASRVSRKPARRMHVWSARGFAEIDFGALTASVVRPSETLLRRQFDVDALSPTEVEHYREHFSTSTCRVRSSATTGRRPGAGAGGFRGEHPHAASAPGDRRAGPRRRGRGRADPGRIHTHAWDDDVAGPVGPMATPRPSVIPSPHWGMAPLASPLERKEAG